MTIQHHGNGQNPPRLLGVSRPRRLRPQLRNTQSWRAISIADMLPAPRINDVLHRVTFAAGWNPKESSSRRLVLVNAIGAVLISFVNINKITVLKTGVGPLQFKAAKSVARPRRAQ